MSERLFYIAFGIDPEDGEAESYFFSQTREHVESWVENEGIGGMNLDEQLRLADQSSAPDNEGQLLPGENTGTDDFSPEESAEQQ